jgi:hypothetical protein
MRVDPPPFRVRENGPDAGDDKIGINSSSLDHPVVILADQSLEIVVIAKTLYCTRVVRVLDQTPTSETVTIVPSLRMMQSPESVSHVRNVVIASSSFSRKS